MEKTLQLNKCRILSGSVLKLLAIISMFIDHSAYILYPVVDMLRVPFNFLGKSMTLYWIMRKIGRPAFPIFCFLITEGFFHTKSKKKYCLRMLIFAFLSEIPFNLMCSGNFLDLQHQNVFFTLLLGLLLMYTYESVSGQFKKFLIMGIIAIVASRLKADYGLTGALLAFVVYLFRNQPSVQALISYPLLSGGGIAAFSAFLPINLYNGQRGFIKSPVAKFLFYIFYPAHILLLVGIRYLLK